MEKQWPECDVVKYAHYHKKKIRFLHIGLLFILGIPRKAESDSIPSNRHAFQSFAVAELLS